MTPQEAYEQCFKLKKMIPELEENISTDPYYSYCYALHIIDAPFKKGECVISKYSGWSYFYARDVIKGPFQKCHHIIFNSEYKDKYIRFLKSINYDLNKISEWLI